MNCYAREYCKKYKTKSCTEHCDVYVILNALYSQTNLPKRYRYDKPLKPQEIDLDSFMKLKRYMMDVLGYVERGEGLFIWSRITGNGKTTWATKIMNYYIRKRVFSTSVENEAIYINVPTFLEDLRQSYHIEDDLEFQDLYNRVLNSRLVIMDDIGSEKPSEWVRERLYTIINHRETNGLTTIYTSNLPTDEIRSNLGRRIYSRIVGSSLIIELKGKDSRGEGLTW